MSSSSISARYLVSHITLTFFTCCLLAGFSGVGSAAPPDNDDFADAEILSGSLPLTANGTNIDATLEITENPPELADPQASVWYAWSPAASGPVQIQTVHGYDEADTMIAVYTGATLDSLSPVTYNDDGNYDSASHVYFQADSAETYYIAVYAEYHLDNAGAFTLKIQEDTGGIVTGTVTGTGGTPVPHVRVHYFVPRDGGNWWQNWASVITLPDGSFRIGNLASGQGKIQFLDRENNLYAPEFYDDAQSRGDATDLSVLAGSVTGPLSVSLQEGAIITGTVTNAADQPLENIGVDAYRWNPDDGYWEWINDAETDANGFYSLGALGVGDYILSFEDDSGAYARIYYETGTDEDSATELSIPTLATYSGIDVTMPDASTISGTVTAPGGTPLEGIRVEAHVYNTTYDYWERQSTTLTDASGNYTLGGMGIGTYAVLFRDVANGIYITEMYDDVDSLDAAQQFVFMTPGETRQGIDAELTLGGSISGTITDSDGAPIPDIDVTVYREPEYMYAPHYIAGEARTDANGQYFIGALSPDDYLVEFADYSGNFYAEEYWDDQLLSEDADPITITGQEAVQNIDAQLADGSRLSGIVTDSQGNPLPGIEVSVIKVTGEFSSITVDTAFTGADGSYQFGGLQTGTYRLWFVDPNQIYQSLYYGGDSEWSSAETIDLGVEEDQNLPNVIMQLGGAITGTVTNSNGAPLSGIEVSARIVGGWEAHYTTTNASGYYRIGGLADATYEVFFSDYPKGDYVGEFHENAATSDEATGVTITGAGEQTINAVLEPAAKISGTLLDPEGNPVDAFEVSIEIYRWNANGSYWESLRFTSPNLDGTYSIGGLSAGDYIIQFSSWAGTYIEEYYNDVTAREDAQTISLTPPEHREGIDAVLAFTPPPAPPQITGFTLTSPNTWQISFTATEGELYQIMKSLTLQSDSWEEEGMPFEAQPGITTRTVQSTEPATYWRIVEAQTAGPGPGPSPPTIP